MPITKCTQDGKPGLKWGDQGHCYTYTPNDAPSMARAKKKVIQQAIAIGEGSKLK